MILYPPFVGVVCGVPLGWELGDELPQPAKNNKVPNINRQIFAESVCLKVFFCIVSFPFYSDFDLCTEPQ
jgi:hypothetical protein